jgi:hypothetical protein
VGELRDLAGDNGVYFYARGYGRLKSAVAGLIESLSRIAAVHLPPAADEADRATLNVSGQSVTVPLAQ